MSKKRYSFTLSENLADRLHLFCQVRNCTPSDAMKQAIDLFLSEQTQKSPRKSLIN